MASLPPQRPASQRRASPPAESSQRNQPTRTNSYTAASVDSQTLLLNSPSSQKAKPEATAKDATSAQTQSQPQEDAEPRKCWICFNDETEDSEPTVWRSPCPCVLVAHEKCLLDWVADMEAPNGRRRAGGNAGKILCPQCKSEIRLERPRSWVVDTVRMVEKCTDMMLLPGFFTATTVAAYMTLKLVGEHAVFQVFGPEDALQVLGPLYWLPQLSNAPVAVQLLQRLRDNWRIDIGLPTIPIILIASRTTMTDPILPFLPLIFFVGGATSESEMLRPSWPPSAAATVAALPYVRGLYNTYYERVWLPRERRWLKEIQPRAGTEDAIQEAEEEGAHNHGDNILDALADDTDEEDGDEVVEIEVDFDIFADWNNGGEAANNNAAENPPVPLPRGPAPPLNAPPREDANDAAPAPNIPRDRAQPRRQRIRREGSINAASLADTILGALIFPSIAAAVGEALRLALPRSWVTPPTSGKPLGFLQARWGRSIVGGCLFVGVKDAVLLYMRWKMAQNHRRRRVLDYDRSKDTAKVGKS